MIIITEQMAERGGICEICKIPITNGIGPSGMPLVTEFLHMFPSSHVFFEAGNFHDVLYHKGCTENDRLSADKKFLELML